MLINVNFENGIVIYNDLKLNVNEPLGNQMENLKEDLLQVSFKDKLVIDVGWFPSFSRDGSFKIVVIKDYDWENPIYQNTCRSVEELINCLEKSLSVVKANL
ncbi:hypothetical protein J4772_22100 [Cohnella sp. LGH]|uniref:hypothetical protein n=1 Tax=Cohnella sp. LGH TaxID=1619153 RepID=UPI001ADAAD34|nr:hypothetical protein [Cohnella sp. LGH]QTH40278.1 hypothetical protein J4772_22100 [Cohnella sp. LGH]